MIKTFCDLCGREIKSKTIHYELTIEVKAAYETLEISLADLLKDHTEEIEALMQEVREADPQQLQDDVYKAFHFHLCRRCQQHYIASPLPAPKPSESGTRFRRMPLPELDD
jgi:hypothetical protein